MYVLDLFHFRRIYTVNEGNFWHSFIAFFCWNPKLSYFTRSLVILISALVLISALCDPHEVIFASVLESLFLALSAPTCEKLPYSLIVSERDAAILCECSKRGLKNESWKVAFTLCVATDFPTQIFDGMVEDTDVIQYPVPTRPFAKPFTSLMCLLEPDKANIYFFAIVYSARV